MARRPLPYSGLALTTRQTPWNEDLLASGMGVRRKIRFERWEQSTYPIRNGYNDPLSCMLVLMGLLNIDEHVQLRASDYANWLSLRYPQVAWDAVTVGKILAVLAEVFEDRYGLKHGLLRGWKTTGGQIWYVQSNGEIASRSVALIEELHDMFLRQRTQLMQGQPYLRDQSPFYDCETMKGELDISDY